MREALRARHYSSRTGQAYCYWVRRFVFFHKIRHPAEMAEAEINAFLTTLAVIENVSTSTQNQALSALLLLYRHAIDRPASKPRSGTVAVLVQIRVVSPDSRNALPISAVDSCGG
jgi:site-specific recombinase XerD